MQKDSRDFLNKLLLTPSPSGFEQKIQAVVKRRMKDYADEIEIDVHGNLIACLNPKGKVRVMLAGHCDQIGMMVMHIDKEGFIYVDQIGGIDPAVLPGTELEIHTREHGAIPAIIGHKPVHLLTLEERGRKTELSKIWVDIGVKNGEEAKKLVSVGDPITYKPNIIELGKNQIAAPGCDDRVGVYVVMEAMRLVKSALRKKGKANFPVALYSVSTVQEEIGLRGARTACYGIDPLVGIAVDVTHATDNPGAEAKLIGTVTLGAGPTIARGPNVNPILEDLLVNTAKKKRIPYQPAPNPRATGTDANSIQISRSGVAAALVSIPNRYMHTSVEVVDLRDLDLAAKLIAETVLAITPRMTFIPA